MLKESTIVSCHYIDDHIKSAKRKRKLALIAAAPQLLAELKAMHSYYCKACHEGCPTLAIIAKAEGR